MNVKRIWIAIVLLLAAAMVAAGCQPARPPAQFDVGPLSLKPAQGTVGGTISVNADISNNGGSEGVYQATLSTDGNGVQTKDVDLPPGTSQPINFVFSLDKPGTYEIAIGNASTAYTVNPKLVPQEMELKNDNSIVKDYLAVVKPFTGYQETFNPTVSTFTISSVRVNGLIYGGHGFLIRDIELQILDKDRKVLYPSELSG